MFQKWIKTCWSFKPYLNLGDFVGFDWFSAFSTNSQIGIVFKRCWHDYFVIAERQGEQSVINLEEIVVDKHHTSWEARKSSAAALIVSFLLSLHLLVICQWDYILYLTLGSKIGIFRIFNILNRFLKLFLNILNY